MGHVCTSMTVMNITEYMALPSYIPTVVKAGTRMGNCTEIMVLQLSTLTARYSGISVAGCTEQMAHP